jgi:hypothetical protein
MKRVIFFYIQLAAFLLLQSHIVRRCRRATCKRVNPLPSNPQPLLKDFLQTDNAETLD